MRVKMSCKLSTHLAHEQIDLLVQEHIIIRVQNYFNNNNFYYTIMYLCSWQYIFFLYTF
jgi:hypothetical protein